MKKYSISVAFLALIVSLGCERRDVIYIDEFEGNKRIIYGRIERSISFDEDGLNRFIENTPDLKWNSMTSRFILERLKVDEKGGVLKAQQYYKGFKVFGRTIGIITDSENHPVYIIDNSFPLENSFVLPDRFISRDEAQEILIKRLKGEVRIDSVELGIVVYTEQPLLRYRMKAFIKGRPFESGTFDVDAVSREVIRYQPALVSSSVSITNTNGDMVNVEISKNPEEYSDTDCADSYCAVDTTRGATELFGAKYIKTFYEIEPAQMAGELPPSSMLFSSSLPDVWEGAMPDGVNTRRIEGISAHYSVQKIYDWYSNLGLKGNVNKDNGLRVYLEKMAPDQLGLNAFWDIYSHSAMVIWVYQPDETKSYSFASSYDVVGHEFTHGVLSAPLSEGGLAELEYNNSTFPKLNESASVQEGFADTMGSLSQGDENPNWLMGYNGLIDKNGNHTYLRNDSDPFDPNALTWGDKEYIGQCVQRLCSKYPPPPGHKEKVCSSVFDMYDSSYVCATTIAYPAWKIKTSIGVDKTARIYFNVIDKYLQKQETITAVSQYVFDSCMDLFNNAEGECCVVYNALTESKFNINLRGVVCGTTADAGMDIVSSDVQNDILTQDATSDVRDVGFDIAEIRDYDILDTSDVTDIADALSNDIYSDEGLDSVDSDTIREDIRDSNTGDIEVSDTELEDNARSDDIVKVSDIRSDQSEESSGCSCSVVE